MPRLPLHLSGSNWPKVSSILGSHRGRVYTRLPFVQQTRERPWREGWELRSSPGPAGILWLETAVSTTGYAPLHMDRTCQSPIPVLQPVRSLQCVPRHRLSPFCPNKGSKQDQQASPMCTWLPHLVPLRLGGPVPGHVWHPPCSYCRLAQATQHTRPTQGSLPHEATFSSL